MDEQPSLMTFQPLLTGTGIAMTTAEVPAFAHRAAGRALEIRQVDGTSQVIAWDIEADLRRVVTTRADGVDMAEIEPDGGHVWWFDADHTGIGIWLRQPFAGGDDKPAMVGTPSGRTYGIAFSQDGSTAAVVVGVADRSHCYAGAPGTQAQLVFDVPGYLGLVDMSPDGQLLALAGSPDGPSAVCLRWSDPAKADNPVVLAGATDRLLWPLEFRPDPVLPAELLLVEGREDGYAIAVWSAAGGIETYDWLVFDSEITAEWYGSERTLLVRQHRAGRATLHLVDLDRREIDPLPTPEGAILDHACAPDGEVHYIFSRADIPPTQLTARPGRPPATVAPRSPRHQAIWTGPVHSFLATPEGTGPWPTILLLHGGPATHDQDCFDPRVELFTGAGFAVVRTNYRGSTGYGLQWRQSLDHTAGLSQIDDLDAVRDHLVESGVSCPDRFLLAGYSWGGYLALLAMGVRPGAWAAAMAAFPIADYVTAYAEATPALREVDRRLFGGSPEEFPDRYRAASPMTYVDDVCGPVLLVASADDEKCPPEQVKRYAAALRDRGERCDLEWVGGGHQSLTVADHSAVIDAMLAFATDVVPSAASTHPEMSSVRPSTVSG